MGETKVAKRYARALYKVKKNNPEAAKKSLEILEAAVELFKDKQVRRVLMSPAVGGDVKQAVLNYVVDQTEGGEEDKRFFHMVVHAGRVAVIPQIATAFRQILNEAEGLVEATVITVTPLPPEDLQQLSKFLEMLEKKKVLLNQEIDKSILGGLVVHVGSNRLDMSLRSKLESIAQSAAR